MMDRIREAMTKQTWSPKTWVRYWQVGCIFGPVVAGYGAATSDWLLIGLGVVVAILAVVMVRFWRRRSPDSPGSETPGVPSDHA